MKTTTKRFKGKVYDVIHKHTDVFGDRIYAITFAIGTGYYKVSGKKEFQLEKNDVIEFSGYFVTNASSEQFFIISDLSVLIPEVITVCGKLESAHQVSNYGSITEEWLITINGKKYNYFQSKRNSSVYNRKGDVVLIEFVDGVWKNMRSEVKQLEIHKNLKRKVHSYLFSRKAEI